MNYLFVLTPIHKNLYYEVNNILKDNNLELTDIEEIYAVCQKIPNNSVHDSLDNNKLILTDLELQMYTIRRITNYGQERHELELNIDYDDTQYNYLVFELKNNKYIVARYGAKDAGYEEDFYYYDDKKIMDYNDFDLEFKNIINNPVCGICNGCLKIMNNIKNCSECEEYFCEECYDWKHDSRLTFC